MSTPGTLNITLYYNASHGLVIQFKDSDGNDFDISSYTDFLMRLYPVSSRSQIGSDIELTRTGSQLDHTFSISDIQGYPSNMRHEILFKNGADVDPVLRGDLKVTDVLKDDTVSTSAEVTLTGDVNVVTVSDVVIVNALGEIKDQTEVATPPDTSKFVGQKADNTLFYTTWTNIKATLKTYFDTLYQSILSEGAFVDGDKTKLDGIESGAEVNDVDSVAGKTGAVSLDLNDLSDTTITNGADNDLLTLESGVWVNKSRIELGLEDAFVIKVKTDNSGVSNNDQFTIPTRSASGTYNYDVDWGDGTLTRGHTGDAIHTYSTAGEYTIKITGDFPQIYFSGSTDAQKLIEIIHWGSLQWSTFSSSFQGCSNIDITAIDVPNLSQASIAFMFYSTSTWSADLNDWDISGITSLEGMFGFGNFQGDIDEWDVSNVTNMRDLFRVNNFDRDISSWDFQSVTDFTRFKNARSFSTANYDALLIRIEETNQNNGVVFDGGTSKYTAGGAAEAARTALINDHSWTITDGGSV